MTAPSPTPDAPLTEEEREARGVPCDQCGHRVIWHHDTRGCGYHGHGENRCPCAIDSDAAVERILAARMGDVWAEAIEASYDYGWLHSAARIEMEERNPYRRGGTDE